MPARRSLLKLSALLILLGITALAVFLATFDLNRYRALVEKSLAGALERPVVIAEAHLSVRHGLALDLSGLQIRPVGDDGSQLTAGHLFLKLDLKELLTGQIIVDEIILSEPHLELRLPPAEPTKAQPVSPSVPERLKAAWIHSLQVEDGTFRIHDPRRPGQPGTLTLRNIHGRIDDLALERRGRIEMTGELAQPGGTAAIGLTGEIEPPVEFSRWPETDVALALNLRQLDPAPLLDFFQPDPEAAATIGRCALALELAGSPSSGLRFEGTLGGDDFSLRFPEHYRSPLEVPVLAFSGTWTAAADSQHLADLHLQTEDLALDGRLTLVAIDAGHRLEGRFTSPPLPIAGLKRLMPDSDERSAPFDFLDERLTGGTLEIEAIHLDGPLGEELPLRSARVRIREAGIRLPQLGDLDGLGAVLDWKEGRLDVQEGTVRLAGESLMFSGSLMKTKQDPPEIALEAYGTLPAEHLYTLLSARDLAEIRAMGPVPVSLSVKGPTDRLIVDLKSDLKHLVINLDSKFNKPAGLEARLFATAEITPGRVELSHGLLSIPPMELRARGTLQRDPQHAFTLALDLAPLDMQQARFRTPLLDQIHPRGRIALEYRLAGARREITEQGGKLLLRDFGMRIPGPVADLRSVSGEVEIDGDTAKILRLSGRLGSSPVTVAGELDTRGGPRLDLRVSAPSISANELIFPSTEKVFHDVEGHLVITREGISFAPVSVRLEEDTTATVRGTLANFKAPDVRLEIEADRADITDIIGLWKRPAGAKDAGKKKKLQIKVAIDARVAEGTLGPLHFRSARGHIESRGKLLIIDPLRFEAGEGNCTGQVVLDRSGRPPALLKISGHLENISAAGLHSELLRRRGMITGTLSGDFYLEGRAGPTFLPTSIGGFDLNVRDGVLRRFRFLSRVFSLLNVSQLFEFNLPDMVDEGMPFEKLAGSFGLQQGILSTDDLFVKSNAMNLSLVGDADLVRDKLDLVLGVKPLRTVDKIVTQIPIAGWLLTGDEKALLTAHFQIRGELGDPEVRPVPITSVSEKVLGIFRRAFSLPGKLITDPKEILQGKD